MKAKAISHPIQGLIKYHGMKDSDLRIPYHDSISLCMDRFRTETEVAWNPEADRDVFVIDGEEVEGRSRERCKRIADELRRIADFDHSIYMKSENNFPSNIGLGASSSGFSALALAGAKAADIDLNYQSDDGLKFLSKIARLGAGSATKSMVGGFARWKAGDSHENSYGYEIASAGELEISVLCVPIRKKKFTEDAHREAVKSPLFECRLKHVEEFLTEMENAIKDKDVEKVFELAEKDSLNLHATTMTGPEELFFWKEDTVRIIQNVFEWREDGIDVYFSIDTGSSVYINTLPEHIEEVMGRLDDIGFEVFESSVGGPAELVT